MKLRLFLLLCLLSPAAWAEPDSSERLKDVQQEIESVSSDLTQKKADLETLYQQQEKHARKISTINADLRQLNNEIIRQEKKLKQLHETHGTTQQAQQAQLKAIYDQVRSAFIHAQPSYLQVLLNQQDVSRVSRTATYYRYFHEARKEDLIKLNQVLNEISEEQKQVLTSQKQLAELLEQQEAQQASLKVAAKQQKETLALLEKSIAQQGNHLAELKAEEAALQQLLDKLAKQSAKAPLNTKPSDPTTPAYAGKAFSKLAGQLIWPVKGKILASYGSQRKLGKLKWQGIVIGASSGKDIQASASGKVVFADWLRGFGLLIIIDHGEQYMTLYGNNETLLRQTGDIVNAGDIIAQSGKQGGKDFSGLYFEVRHKGNPKNPLKWLKKT